MMNITGRRGNPGVLKSSSPQAKIINSVINNLKIIKVYAQVSQGHTLPLSRFNWAHRGARNINFKRKRDNNDGINFKSLRTVKTKMEIEIVTIATDSFKVCNFMYIYTRGAGEPSFEPKSNVNITSGEENSLSTLSR